MTRNNSASKTQLAVKAERSPFKALAVSNTPAVLVGLQLICTTQSGIEIAQCSTLDQLEMKLEGRDLQLVVIDIELARELFAPARMAPKPTAKKNAISQKPVEKPARQKKASMGKRPALVKQLATSTVEGSCQLSIYQSRADSSRVGCYATNLHWFDESRNSR